MGGAVARRLATGDFDVTVYDPDSAAVDRCVAAGAHPADSAVGAATGAEILVTSLPTPEIGLQTVDAVLGHLASGTALVDVSTIDPATAVAARDRCMAAGVDFVACPLGKMPAHAEQGEIPLFVGGEPEVVRRLQPLLARMGNVIHDMGSVEAATTIKLVSNQIGMTNVAVLAEGYALARRAGIDPETFKCALADTGAASFQEQVRLPWIMAGDWAPRFGVDLALKDVRLAVESASRWGVPAPVSSATLAQLAAASAHGYGAEDVVAIAKVIDPRTK